VWKGFIIRKAAMAQNNSASAPHRRSSGWRGRQSQEVARHRWQRSTGDGVPFWAREPWRSLRIAAWFATAAGLAALLLFYLLYAPERTPVLTVVATDYNWPLPPNAWATEDHANLRELDGETLVLHDLSEAWRSKERGLAQLTTQLVEAHRRQGSLEPIVIYLSLHGAVDGAGRACLIPPASNSQDSETWLPLADVLAAIDAAKLPPRQPKLLVLDCSRQLVNWNIGLLASGLADALTAEVNAAQVPGLVILNSAGLGERAIASPELRGSVFGHYFRLGLAGAADRRSAGGNGNGRVSLHELARYLVEEVDGWTKHHLASRQQPLLVPGNAADFEVAVGMRTSSWQTLLERTERIERGVPAVPASTLSQHWRAVDQLRKSFPWRFDPVAWRTLEQQLLWLEELSQAGSAYTVEAKSLNDSLTAQLAELESRQRSAQERPSIGAYDGLLERVPPTALPPAGSSLEFAVFWGTLAPDQQRSLAQALEVCQQAPSEANLAAAAAAIEQAGLPGSTIEQGLVHLWQRFHVPALWPDATLLSRTLAARLAAERLAVPVASTEGIGIPGDPRAHAWLRPQLATLNQTCRILEDAVLAGPGQRDLDAELTVAAAEIQRCEELAEELAGAYALRDRLWAELAYHAQWATRLEFDPDRQQTADALVRQTLLPLIADGLALEARLSNATTDENADPAAGRSAEANSAALEAAREVREGWGKLESEWLQTLSRLQSAEMTAQSVAEIDAALASPLVPADARQRLSQKRADIASDLATRYAQEEAGNDPPAAVSKAAPRHRERLSAWGEHPLLSMLAIDVEQVEEQLELAAAGEQIRQELRTLALADLTNPNAGVPSVRARSTGWKPAAAADLSALGRAESRVRVASGLWFDPPVSDPVRRLQRAELQQLCLASARRALDDFYGPVRPGAGEGLFAIAAAGYLKAAEQLAPAVPATQVQIDDLRQLLARRRIAALESLAVQASDLLLVEQATSISSTIDVSERPGGSGADLPPGELAVFLADQAGRIGTDAWTIKSPPAAAADKGPLLLAATTTIASATVADRGPHLQAIATLRGNDFAAPLLLRSPGGTRVEFTRPMLGPPQVTVLGSQLKSASLAFVLDCSNSMGKPAYQEGPDGAARPQTPRLDVAKGALRSMLAEIADQGTARIGVRFFGHRVGWSTVEDNKLLRQTAWPGEIPAELRPYADVESVLPLGRFDSTAAGLVSDKLAAALPWGETPLYLAISQSLAEFGTEDEDLQRCVIVITDGENYQFNPPESFQRTADQIIAEARRAEAAIFIIGFNVSEEAASAEAEFDRIATETGGRYLPASGATAFLRQVDSLLQPGDFRVTGTGGAVERAPLGEVVTLPQPTTREAWTVAYDGLTESIEVDGGERIELAVSQGDRRLRVPPFQNPRLVSLVSAEGTATSLAAGLHRAVRSQEEMTFPISLQDQQGRFVARPREMWVEIVPRMPAADEQPAPYIFYDAPFQPGTPVPLVRLPASNWPSGAARAVVQMWVRDTPAQPADRVLLSKVADLVPSASAGFPIAGVPGVAYQARTFRGPGGQFTVGLVERHGADSPGVGSVKVALSPPADHVVHQFDGADRVVLHTFTYRTPPENLAERLEIRFTTRAAVLAGARRLAQETEISVSDRADLIELAAPQ
jgi:hypothetical protein